MPDADAAPIHRQLGLTDAELEALVATLPEDHVAALDKLAGAREGGFEDPAGRTVALRAAGVGAWRAVLMAGTPFTNR